LKVIRTSKDSWKDNKKKLNGNNAKIVAIDKSYRMAA
jgi:hypothetical protein